MKASGITLRKTIVVTLQQIGLGAVLFLLLAGWLQIPDANVLEITASVLVALLMALVAGGGEAAIALRLVNRQLSIRRLITGAGTVLLAALLWYAFASLLDHAAANDGLRAGYLNSKFPAGLRNLFSYQHIILWFGWLWGVLRWSAAGLFASLAFAAIVCEQRLPCLRSILRSVWYWIAVAVLALTAGVLTGALLRWTPGHGIRLELLSVVSRLITVVLLNAAAGSLLLQGMANAVAGVQLEGTDEPAISQPRTADIP